MCMDQRDKKGRKLKGEGISWNVIEHDIRDEVIMGFRGNVKE